MDPQNTDTATGADDSAIDTTPNTGTPGADAGDTGDTGDTAGTDAGQGTGEARASTGYSDEDAYRLAEINARVEADPNLVLSDEEQALWEAGADGVLVAKNRPEGAEDNKTAAAQDAHLETVFKEVGAKSTEELAAKVRELRAFVGSRDAQAYAELQKQFTAADEFRRGEEQLYADAAAGKPEALLFLEQKRGLKVVPVGATGGTPGATQGTDGAGAPELFSADDDGLVGGALSKLQSHYEEKIGGLQGKLDTILKSLDAAKAVDVQTRALTDARNQTVQEMMEVAQLNDELKGLPQLKERLTDFIVNGKEDAQLSPYFSRLFEVAKEYGTTLKAAHLIERGKNSDALVAKAREDGVKRAMGRPENKSMSGVASRDDSAGLQSVTETQLAAFEGGDLYALPQSWFDAEGNFVKANIPAKFHDRLGV